ncbi:YHS domain-containing (seleno)protein [Pseudodonghicola xiamenensis]|uniref:YHS domain-containing protein n=1 Tax=Pseudodonghicola xiamenensis TaxID=337702 RepID=A0A8J3HBH6_9RHOB|nr:YHS domain-containing (seleno)protein [Pseudodonghicola xiamenensis]GHG99995.1 hypothetical protein GCM10010961_36330 [Pseudodonghicola xiamenensis]
MRFRPILSACLFLLLFAGVARAGGKALFYTHDGVAVSGYDVVAYFVEGEPLRGRPEIAVKWRGAIWRFVDHGNRERFEADPHAYAPQYGGYCAYAMASGSVSGSDPRFWRIVGGKLYLIHDARRFNLWATDPAGFVARGDKNWPAALFR